MDINRLVDEFQSERPLTDPLLFGRTDVSVKYLPKQPDLLLIEKLFDIKELKVTKDHMLLIKHKLFDDNLFKYKQTQNQDTYLFQYISGSLNLNDYAYILRKRGARKMPSSQYHHLCRELISICMQFQRTRDYFPQLNMSSTYVTKQGIRAGNPYCFKQYIIDSMHNNEKAFSDKLKTNIKFIGLTVLYASILYYDTHLLDESGQLDEKYLRVALEHHRKVHPDAFITTDMLESMIYGRDSALGVMGKIFQTSANHIYSDLKDEDYLGLMQDKMNSSEGIFNRDYRKLWVDDGLDDVYEALNKPRIHSNVSATDAFMVDRRERHNYHFDRTVLSRPSHPEIQRSRSRSSDSEEDSPAKPAARQNGQLAGSQNQQRPGQPAQSSSSGPGLPASPEKKPEKQGGGKGVLEKLDDKVHANELAYGRVEMMYRERRMKEDMNVSLRELSREKSAPALHKKYTTGNFAVNPTTFSFPVLDATQSGRYASTLDHKLLATLPKPQPQTDAIGRGRDSQAGIGSWAGGDQGRGGSLADFRRDPSPMGPQPQTDRRKRIDRGRPYAFTPDLELLDRVKGRSKPAPHSVKPDPHSNREPTRHGDRRAEPRRSIPGEAEYEDPFRHRGAHSSSVDWASPVVNPRRDRRGGNALFLEATGPHSEQQGEFILVGDPTNNPPERRRLAEHPTSNSFRPPLKIVHQYDPSLHSQAASQLQAAPKPERRAEPASSHLNSCEQFIQRIETIRKETLFSNNRYAVDINSYASTDDREPGLLSRYRIK